MVIWKKKDARLQLVLYWCIFDVINTFVRQLSNMLTNFASNVNSLHFLKSGRQPKGRLSVRLWEAIFISYLICELIMIVGQKDGLSSTIFIDWLIARLYYVFVVVFSRQWKMAPIWKTEELGYFVILMLYTICLSFILREISVQPVVLCSKLRWDLPQNGSVAAKRNMCYKHLSKWPANPNRVKHKDYSKYVHISLLGLTVIRELLQI